MYLTAQRVASIRGSGVNAFFYTHAGVPQPFNAETDELHRVIDDNPGEPRGQFLAVPPGGNAVHSFLDIVGPDAVPIGELRGMLEGLAPRLLAQPRSTVRQGALQARYFADPRWIPEPRGELRELFAAALGLRERPEAQRQSTSEPFRLEIVDTNGEWLLRVSSRDLPRFRELHGPEWRPGSLKIGHELASDLSGLAPLLRHLVPVATGFDLDATDDFGGVEVVGPSGSVLWEWPSGPLIGVCLCCHRTDALRQTGPSSFLCAFCGSMQDTNGRWLATL